MEPKDMYYEDLLPEKRPEDNWTSRLCLRASPVIEITLAKDKLFVLNCVRVL